MDGVVNQSRIVGGTVAARDNWSFLMRFKEIVKILISYPYNLQCLVSSMYT